MVTEINIDEIYELNWPVIDVRSPGEYEKGHIPHSVNIPLFENDERAQVGTVYKQQSKEKAIQLGLQFVTPKLTGFIEKSFQVAPAGKAIVHCWRGGMRSQAFARHLHENGFHEIRIVKGGYKTFRNYLLNFFAQPFQLNVLGGFTGSGKTQILKEMRTLGLQVIDLENMANHKGSAFGAIGQNQQPTVEQFENNLFEEWRKLDINAPIWLEDESHQIGGVNIPMPLFEQIRNARLFFIDIPKEMRARFLVSEYTACDNQLLIDAIERITKRLGGLNAKSAVELIRENKYDEAALITLNYYDKSYLKGLRMRNPELVVNVPLKNTNHFENAIELVKISKAYERNKTYAV